MRPKNSSWGGGEMAGWPKTIFIRGVGIPVDSWEELEEVIHRFGSEGPVVIQGTQTERGEGGQRSQPGPYTLSHTDRSLLRQFIEGDLRGVPTIQIGPALGKRGKGIRRALEAWSRRIGLVTEDGASAFEPVKSSAGRGFRLSGIYLQAARSMLETR